jgi:hypothetical protein
LVAVTVMVPVRLVLVAGVAARSVSCTVTDRAVIFGVSLVLL